MSTVTLEVSGSARRESFEEWIVVSIIIHDNYYSVMHVGIITIIQMLYR